MAKEYFVKRVWGVRCVLCENTRREYSTYKGVCRYTPKANFCGSGLALCGRLKRDQTLEDWINSNSK